MDSGLCGHRSFIVFVFLVESLQHRLESLEEEEEEEEEEEKMEEEEEEEEQEVELGLPFQLPSRQRALCSLLVHLGAQAEAALHRTAQQ